MNDNTRNFLVKGQKAGVARTNHALGFLLNAPKIGEITMRKATVSGLQSSSGRAHSGLAFLSFLLQRG